MRIVEIVPVTKTKYRVVTDEQLAFMLYKGELSRYRLKENGELSAEIFQEIFREILVKRAKLRAMASVDTDGLHGSRTGKETNEGRIYTAGGKNCHGLCAFVPLSG